MRTRRVKVRGIIAAPPCATQYVCAAHLKVPLHDRWGSWAVVLSSHGLSSSTLAANRTHEAFVGGTRPKRSTHRSERGRPPDGARRGRSASRAGRRRLPAQPALRSFRDGSRRRVGTDGGRRGSPGHQAIGAIWSIRRSYRRNGLCSSGAGDRRTANHCRRDRRAPRHLGKKQGLHARGGFRAAGIRRTVALEATGVREPRSNAGPTIGPEYRLTGLTPHRPYHTLSGEKLT